MVYLINPKNTLQPGDILLTVFHPLDWWAWPIMAATASGYVHATIYLGDGKEWSVQERGSIIRPVGTDRIQYAFRPLDQEAAKRAVEIALANPVAEYDWANMVWQGVQCILAPAGWHREDLPWKNKAQICSEAVSDLFVEVGFDLVPEFENGATLPRDLANSKLVMRL